MRDRPVEKETEKERLFCCGQEQICIRAFNGSCLEQQKPECQIWWVGRTRKLAEMLKHLRIFLLQVSVKYHLA